MSLFKRFLTSGRTFLATFALVAIFTSVMPAGSAYAAATDFFNPNQTVASNSVTNPNSGWVSDNARAVFDNGLNPDTVEYGFPDLGIPSNAASIDGIEVTIEGRRNSSNSTRNFNVAIWNTSNSNPDAYTSSKKATLTDSDTVITLGGSLDKWSKTWTVADFADATFKLRVQAADGGAGHVAELDSVRFKVYYTPAAKVNTTTVITNTSALATATLVGQTYAVNWSVSESGPASPTGSVIVSDGTDTCVAAVGAGTCTLTSTTAGTKTITASYGGDSNFNGSESAGVSHAVNTPVPFENIGLVTFTFDDGYKSQFENVGKLGSYKGTFYVNSDTMKGAELCGGIADPNCYGDYMRTQSVLALDTAGHEIGAHTRSHICNGPDDEHCNGLAGATLEELLYEVDGNRHDLLGLGINATVSNFAYPFGASDEAAIAKIKSAGFVGGRSVNPGLNQTNTDRYALFARQINNTTTLADVQSWIDDAVTQKKWLILVVHEVETNCSGEEYCTTPEALEAIVSYVSSREANLDVVTMSQGLDLLDNKPVTMPGLPVITQENIVVAATSTEGAHVSFPTSVTDDDFNAPALSAFCVDPSVFVPIEEDNDVAYEKVLVSGQQFPIGIHTVKCSAADTGGNVGFATFTITVTQATDVITFEPAAKTYGDEDFDLVATTASGLPVSFEIVSGPAALAGNTVHITGAGEVIVAASTTGDATYLPANTQKSFTVAKADTITTVFCPASVIYNGEAQTPCTAEVTGPLEFIQTLEVAYENNVDVGTATATATYAGDDHYNASTDTKTFAIDAIGSTEAIEITGLEYTFDGAAKSATVTVADDLEHTVTYNGATDLPVNAGSYDVLVTITQLGHSGSKAATLVINPAEMTVTPDANQFKLFKNPADADPVLTYTSVVTLPEGYVFGGALTRADASNHAIGLYEITAGTLAVGTMAGEEGSEVFIASDNYQVTVTGGVNFEIAADPSNLPPELTFTGTLDITADATTDISFAATDDLEAALVWTIGTPTSGSVAPDTVATGETAATVTYTPDALGFQSFDVAVFDGNGTTTKTVEILVRPLPFCAEGTSLNVESGLCEQVDTTPVDATPSLTCAEGAGELTDIGEGVMKCVKDVAETNPPSVCATGFELVGDQCVDNTDPENPITGDAPTCPEGTTTNGEGQCETTTQEETDPVSGFTCPNDSYELVGEQCVPKPITPSEQLCPIGWHFAAGQCDVGNLYTISATVTGSNGSISPSGDVSVIENDSKEFTFSPSTGYRVKNVTVDTESKGNVGSFTFENVTADHAISVEFEVIPSSSPAPRSSSGSGGSGGSGSSYVAPVATTTATTTSATTTPEVLGTATQKVCYQFTKTLQVGSTGADVTELQTILIAKGYLAIAAPTGYYGSMTAAAVSALQKDNGLEQVGVVGPKTRALLNQCDGAPTGSSMTEEQKQALIKALQEQLDALLKQIAELIAAQQAAASTASAQ